jgi:outer membrane protein OmpA-like peptidoglycan-associated protein
MIQTKTIMNKYSIRIIISFVYLFFSGLTAFSQNDHSPGDAQDASGGWKTGWHLDVGGGSQTLFASDVKNLSLERRFTPAVTLAAGKWFSPFWGVRLQAGGYSLNGFAMPVGTFLYAIDPIRDRIVVHPDGSHPYYLRYINAQLAVQAELLNLLGGYGNDRRWSIIPAIGIGGLRSLGYKGTPVMHNLTANASLRGKFALNARWDINIEVSATALDGDFDGRISPPQKYDAFAGVTLGMTYNFSKVSHKPRVKTPKKKPENTLYEKIDERLSAIETKLDQLSSREPAPVKIIEKVVEEKKTDKHSPRILASILFDFNKDQPIKGEEINLVNVVKYLKENPEARIRMDGYGDKQIGTPEQNLDIADKRLRTIRLMLFKQGINPDRIEMRAIGSESQPYDLNKWNRVVVIYIQE